MQNIPGSFNVQELILDKTTKGQERKANTDNIMKTNKMKKCKSWVNIQAV